MSETTEYGEFPIKSFLGMSIDDVADGHASARLEVGDVHLNPNGVVHGAVLFAMVDTAMGKAVMSLLPEGRFCATVDVQIRFISAASAGALVAHVEVLRMGRSVSHLEGRVVDGDGRLVATAAGTFAVIGG